MNENEAFTYSEGRVKRFGLRMRRHRPVGWAEVDGSGTLAGLLGQIGAERLSRRYAVRFEDDTRATLIEMLSHLAGRSSYFDRAWILLKIRRLDGEAVAGFVALLSRAQLFDLPPAAGAATLLLDNGRVVETIDPHDTAATLLLDNGRVVETIDPHDTAATTLEYQGARYVDGETVLGPQDGEVILIATPSTPFSDLIRTRHSYYCVLNPAHRGLISSDYVCVRNLFVELDYPDLHAALPLRVIFDLRVPIERVVLDSTTLFAIGLPQGEPVALMPCAGRASRIRSALFGSRHAIARVGRTAVIDIEKPVTRLPEEMLDLLGLASGHRVIVEAVTIRSGRSRVTRTSLRALPWRERSPLLVARGRTGVPDNQQLVGDEDFPQISLDLATRERLGVAPGGAVYVRPAISSLLAREFTSASFILIGAIFSAAALQSIALAVISASVYVVLALLIVGARLR